MQGPDLESFDPNNPYTAIALLGMRVTNLGKEKEAIEKALAEERVERAKLEKRVSKMENSYQRGAGILIGLSFLGAIGGFLAAYGKAIFKPWTGP
jgi:hypothetical protein